MKKVLVFGTFDIFHPGHLYFLKEARRFGDFLIVIVARDKTVKKIKKRKPKNGEKKRLADLKKTGLVDHARLGNLDDPYRVIKEEKPGVICLGYDQKVFVRKLSKKLKEFNLKTKVVRLKPYKANIYKSSRLRKKILLLATRNKGKIREYKIFLKNLPFKVLTLEDLEIKDDFLEKGRTIKENAIGKAKYFGRLTGFLALADDTGLKVNALGGKPGIRSKRYAGENKTNLEIVRFVLRKMKDIPEAKRQAKFVCTIAVFDPLNKKLIVASDEASGSISAKISKGKCGFCYDCIFYYPRSKKTFSEMPQKEKNALSHRGRAFRKIERELKQFT